MPDYVEELENEISRLAAAESNNFSHLLNLAEDLKKSDKLTVDIDRSSGLKVIAGEETFVANVLPGDAGFSVKLPGGTATAEEFPALWNALRRAVGESLYKQATQRAALEGLRKFLGNRPE